MRIIAFITGASTLRDILVHLGEPTAPPRIAPARGPPLWEAPALSTIHPPIRRYRPPRPSSSTSASPGSHDRRRSSLRDAGLARTCPGAAESRRLTRTTDPNTITHA